MNFELLETWDKWLLVISSFSVVKIVFLKKTHRDFSRCKGRAQDVCKPAHFRPRPEQRPGRQLLPEPDRLLLALLLPDHWVQWKRRAHGSGSQV
jgi:hypothetical protein